MKRITSRVIFVLTALCILLQAQPVYAEQIILSAETEYEQPDNPQEEKPQKPIPGAVSAMCVLAV